MNRVLQRRFEMAVRVRDFLRAHRTDSVAEGAALSRLEALVERGEALATQQRAGVLAAKAASAHRGELRRALQTKLLNYLSGVGAVAARENAELGAQFRLPRTRATNQAFVTLVQGMLDKATAEKELLLSRGMSEHLLDDLAAALAEFEQTLAATRAGRLEHVGASGDLQAVASEISQQVRLLDGMVRYRFGKNVELMAAWASARNVFGPVRSHTEQQAGGDTPGAAAPAA